MESTSATAPASTEGGGGRSKRARVAVDYRALDSSEGEDVGRFRDTLYAKLPTLGPPALDTLESGASLTLPWLRQHGLHRPVMVKHKAGLGLRVPPPGFSVRDVAQVVGEHWPIEVLDVSLQEGVPGSWTLGEWADFYHTPPAQRRRVLNVITLEFSGTPLAQRVRSPAFVRTIDWIDTVWPGFRHALGEYPLVQLYCLMSVAGSWTDFHLDFGGTSVWYHVHTGAKTFVFLPPTPAALAAYELWTRSPTQSRTFFTDTLGEEERGAAFSVTITAGQTLIIPAGYIHAVFTPQDSLVFGGNYLHGMAMDTQLRIYELELASRVKKRYRFPYYEHIQWYALAYYVQFTRLPGFKALYKRVVGGGAAGGGEGGEEGEREGMLATLGDMGLSIHELRCLPSLLMTLRHLRDALVSRLEGGEGGSGSGSSSGGGGAGATSIKAPSTPRSLIKGAVKFAPGTVGEDEYQVFPPSQAASEAAHMAGCPNPEALLIELATALSQPVAPSSSCSKEGGGGGGQTHCTPYLPPCNARHSYLLLLLLLLRPCHGPPLLPGGVQEGVPRVPHTHTPGCHLGTVHGECGGSSPPGCQGVQGAERGCSHPASVQAGPLRGGTPTLLWRRRG